MIEDQQLPTFPCQICGRHFIQSSLEKHIPACKKLTKMQRKVFDSGKQRAIGSDVPLSDVRKVAKEREKVGGVFPRPSTNWRERHEEFIGVVSASKQVDRALKTGAPLPPPPRTAMPADYTRCDYCGRSFNKNAAERHIDFCRELSLRQQQLSTKGSSNTPASKSATQQKRSGKPPTSSGSKEKAGALSANATSNRNGMVLPEQNPLSKSGYGKLPPSSTTSTASSKSSLMGPPAVKKRASSMKRVPSDESEKNGHVHGKDKKVPSSSSSSSKTGAAGNAHGSEGGSQIPVPRRSNSLQRHQKIDPVANSSVKGKQTIKH